MSGISALRTDRPSWHCLSSRPCCTSRLPSLSFSMSEEHLGPTACAHVTVFYLPLGPKEEPVWLCLGKEVAGHWQVFRPMEMSEVPCPSCISVGHRADFTVAFPPAPDLGPRPRSILDGDGVGQVQLPGHNPQS